eukprot:TRINITY_DN95997_c0_g1_i1.p1 TRINITY_DN95997_c0_g1~~TRINITY_DN95997_c0_g1_i1.p1  ORF type:complete len:266 (+),score=55.82 TRINITY_DN95997_c0_g1_i1:37-834(+)
MRRYRTLRQWTLSHSRVSKVACFSLAAWFTSRIEKPSLQQHLSAFAIAKPLSTSVPPGTSPVEEQPVITELGAGSKVLVVGASRGIGLEFVRQLLSRGCQVIATHREDAPPQTLHGVANERLSYLRMDVSDADSISKAAASLSEKGTKLTHIVHNAGIYGPTVTLDGKERQGRPAAPAVSKDVMLRVFEVNAVGPLLVVQRFIDLLQAPDGQLPIIAILTSKVGSVDDNGSGGAYAYRASKSACNIIAKSIYVDLRSEGLATVVL